VGGHGSTVLRHAGDVRLAHLTWAIAGGWLSASGLGIHERLPAWAIHLLGGHVVLVTWHGRVGDMLGLALLLAAFFVRKMLSRFLGAIMQFHRADAAWPLALLRSLRHPRQQPVLPWHDGRFDPAQRLIFLILIGSFTLLVMTGLAFNFIPTNIRLLFAWTVRIHLAAAWVLIAAVGVHIIAGTGLLPTHRGVARAMFGDGRVRIDLARRLWPGWTARRPESKSPRKA
jgi:formate dehydrogenase subunit gamma